MPNKNSMSTNDVAPETVQAHNLSSGWEQELADCFLTAWQAAHGKTKSQAKVLVNLNILTILLEDTFTEAEMAMAQDSTAQLLLQRYIDQLYQQVSAELIARVEEATGRAVVSNHVSSSLTSGWIMCTFKLGSDHASQQAY